MKRIGVWLFIISLYSFSANPGAEDSLLIDIQSGGEFTCVADNNIKLVLFEAKSPVDESLTTKRTLKIFKNNTMIAERKMSCSMGEDSLYCSWSAYFNVLIDFNYQWFAQDEIKSKPTLSGYWQIDPASEKQKVVCFQ